MHPKDKLVVLSVKWANLKTKQTVYTPRTHEGLSLTYMHCVSGYSSDTQSGQLR